MLSRATPTVAVLALGLALNGCSVRQMAADRLGDILASGGTTFATDDDPELVRAAAPFSLKLMESLINERPDHRGLLTAAASGFTRYAYVFVQQEADEVEDRDLATAYRMRERARKLYRRARDYGLRGLDVARPGFSVTLRANPASALDGVTTDDVPLLYWTGASWAAMIALSKDDADAVADVPLMGAIMDRALAVDESFDAGAIHTFMISYEMVRPGGTGDPALRARGHFRRAVELSAGQQAGPYVTLAEAVSVQKQDRKEFEALLGQALAVNADASPEWRLVNVVMQRRARWLLDRTTQLFTE